MANSNVLQITEFPGKGDPSYLFPPLADDVAPLWDGLANDSVLKLQHCTSCGRVRNPVAPVCPYCSSEAFDWQEMSGAGEVFSWIRYQRSYIPEFESLMPYVVLTVQLDEGPRMFGRFASEVEPEINMRVQAIGERWPDGRVVPAFVPLS